MFTIYVYVLDTLADWELGYVTSELNSGRFFKKGAQHILLKTVSYSKEPINTMGGMKVMPDCLIDDIVVNETSILLLPGADTWGDPKHGAIIEKAREFLSSGATVCAICGATTALANSGLLDNRSHTSNGPGFLEMISPCYKGQSFYIDKPSVADNNLITAASTGALLWAKQIIEHLGVFQADTRNHGMNTLVPASLNISLPLCKPYRLAMKIIRLYHKQKGDLEDMSVSPNSKFGSAAQLNNQRVNFLYA